MNHWAMMIEKSLHSSCHTVIRFSYEDTCPQQISLLSVWQMIIYYSLNANLSSFSRLHTGVEEEALALAILGGTEGGKEGSWRDSKAN